MCVVGSVLFLLFAINERYTALVPTAGGSVTEAILGTPRFVNPVLALTRADRDMTALLYSGLMRINEQGELVPDLAESISVSEDGLIYTVVVRRDVRFHDGTPLTANDAIFTIALAQDPDLKSPLRANWANVVVTPIDEYTFTVAIEEPYAAFIENFTLGIMPEHLWGSLPIEQLPFSQHNTEPIGTGRFSLTNAVRNPSGLIEAYVLQAFLDHPYPPRLDTMQIQFYDSEAAIVQALKDGVADATTYLSPRTLETFLLEHPEFTVHEMPTARLFGIFFNQNRSRALRDESARRALTAAVDRTAIIHEAVLGRGVPINTPTRHSTTGLESQSGTSSPDQTPESAVRILQAGGWRENNQGRWEKQIDGTLVTFDFTIRTSNGELFGTVADTVVAQWQALGIAVVSEQFEQAGLVQSVIRPRDFEALLFGIDTSRTDDLYSFWHSSQKDDPGLNIAQYTNLTVDELLETARRSTDRATREAATAEAIAIINDEVPAVFLFSPTLTYVVAPDITITTSSNIGSPPDRFATIDVWHREQDRLWPIFRDAATARNTDS
jgi:peptide/nickel transport system substrate-binding protein